MTWSAASVDGFRFVSNPANTVSAFAQLGQMHNGVFFGGQVSSAAVEGGGF